MKVDDDGARLDEQGRQQCWLICWVCVFVDEIEIEIGYYEVERILWSFCSYQSREKAGSGAGNHAGKAPVVWVGFSFG